MHLCRRPSNHRDGPGGAAVWQPAYVHKGAKGRNWEGETPRSSHAASVERFNDFTVEQMVWSTKRIDQQRVVADAQSAEDRRADIRRGPRARDRIRRNRVCLADDLTSSNSCPGK